jgi:uncharacterized protein
LLAKSAPRFTRWQFRECARLNNRDDQEEPTVGEGPFKFEWDEEKAGSNARKHRVSFELASTVFHDPHLLTVADLEHSDSEDRWFSVGCASNGAILTVVYLWSNADPQATKVRLISARRATSKEVDQYQGGL